MKSLTMRGIAGAALLGVALMVGVGASSSGTVQAQYGEGRYERDFVRIARDQGFRDGSWEGENRARARRSYDPYNTHSYKKATDGYNNRMGSKYEYQQAYRQGYLRGYEEGYSRYGGRRY